MLVTGPVEVSVLVTRPVSLALLQAAVWVVVVVVVVVCVKPALAFGGFVTSDVVVLVVVPQSLTLSAWAAGENQAPPTAINAAKVVATVRFLNEIGLLLSARTGLRINVTQRAINYPLRTLCIVNILGRSRVASKISLDNNQPFVR